MKTLGPFRTVQEFMTAVWSEPKQDGSFKRLFRGQTDDWPLLPKLFRGLGDKKELPRLGETLLDRFRERSLFLMPSMPSHKLEVLSMAQHYGLPTRLLDWTANPLMALFFAVERRSLSNPVVWLYDVLEDQLPIRQNYDLENAPYEHDRVVAFQPSFHSPRVAAQAGWHTIHWLRRLQNDSMESESLEVIDSDRVAQCHIDRTSAGNIREELRSIGIHATTVFGDLGSICREIEDECDLPPAMRRDASYWSERQQQMKRHILAMLFLNGAKRSAGQYFTWRYPVDSQWGAMGETAPLSQSEIDAAHELADKLEPPELRARFPWYPSNNV